MGFLPLSVSLFPVGLPQRPTSVQMGVGKAPVMVNAHRCLNLYQIYLFVCMCVCACLSQNFLSFFTQFVKVNLLKSKLHLSVLGLSPHSLCGATASILHYTAYLLRPCVYIQRCTRFPLTLGAEKWRLLRPVSALSKYQPAPTLSPVGRTAKWTFIQSPNETNKVCGSAVLKWLQIETNTHLHTLSNAFRLPFSFGKDKPSQIKTEHYAQ